MIPSIYYVPSSARRSRLRVPEKRPPKRRRRPAAASEDLVQKLLALWPTDRRPDPAYVREFLRADESFQQLNIPLDTWIWIEIPGERTSDRERLKRRIASRNRIRRLTHELVRKQDHPQFFHSLLPSAHATTRARPIQVDRRSVV